MTKQLSLATLASLPDAVGRPSYPRGDLKAGIVHFGVGNFHRAHQAVYLHDLFETGLGLEWAIVGAGVLPSDAAMRAILAGQDFLTTVVEQEADSSTARVTGAMIDYLEPGAAETIIARLADPAIRIASLTITEGGYYLDPASGKFNPAHPDIVADCATPDAPKTVFGLLAAGLRRRKAEGTAPFTVMSCDNIPHNGVVTRNAVVGIARAQDPAFAGWIETNVAFPNGMVDRITPATGAREKAIVRDAFGIEDGWPVFCEGFKQWVLEDNFPAGRPPLEQAGVQFVPDVTPYEHMKIRILNGGHAIIAYPAGLMDIHFVHEAMQNELVSAFLRKVEMEEIVPVVPPVPGTDLLDYLALIERRFANPKIGDTVRRLCLDGSNRQPKFILPSTADRLAKGLPVTGLALESALWCRYCYGETESGAVIEPNDPAWDRLRETARLARHDPMEWLAMDDIFGTVGRSEIFRAAFANALTTLWAEGTEATLRRYLSGTLG